MIINLYSDLYHCKSVYLHVHTYFNYFLLSIDFHTHSCLQYILSKYVHMFIPLGPLRKYIQGDPPIIINFLMSNSLLKTKEEIMLTKCCANNSFGTIKH